MNLDVLFVSDMNRLLTICFYAVSAFLIGSVGWVVLLRFVPVTYTPLMTVRQVESVRQGTRLDLKHRWVSLDRVSPALISAVIASEDAHFYEHNGFSEEGIRRALKEHREGGVRHGGSTISQQTAKNVFCLPHRTMARKVLEAYYTLLIELLWGKDRILEVYLNVAEMGDGVFGVEAAANRFFGCRANLLTKEQSALLAACLPNPRVYQVTCPSDYVRSRQQTILLRTCCAR